MIKTLLPFKHLVPAFAAAPDAPGVMQFSNEINAGRRRKASGPQGRADAPVNRQGGGSPSGPSGGNWQPSMGGGGGGGGRLGGSGLRLPAWMIILILICLLIFGGWNLLGDLLGTGTDVTLLDQNPPTAIPGSGSGPVSGFTPPASSGSGTWTVMLYQDADDQILEQDVFTDFNEAERVGSSDKVNIVSQLDRYRGAFSGDGNWTSTRRYYLTQDNDLNAINSQLVADLGELSMSDPVTLVDFVTWAVQTLPADHYVLILSDHGMGWPGGWVDPTPASSSIQRAPLAQVVGNALYLDQLDAALAEIQAQTGVAKFDIIGLDACLMGQVEVLTALQPYARIAITSEETEPSLGWAYTAFLDALVRNPGMSAADLSRLVVQSYIDNDLRIVDDQARADFLSQMGSAYTSANQLAALMGRDATLSAYDLEALPDLLNSLNDLSYALQNEDQSVVAGARSYALSFTSVFGKSVPPSYIDLGSFLQILYQQSRDNTVREYASQAFSALRSGVIAEKNGSSRGGASGLSIYFPNSSLYRSPSSGLQSYTVIANRFAQASLWDDFLAFHYSSRGFEAASREAVLPDPSLPSRAPGLGQFSVGALQLSSDSAAPGVPVTMRAEINGTNIGNIYLFVGYYDGSSNAIFVADTDFLESPTTQTVDGVSYPLWGTEGSFTVRFDWDPVVFTISDGQNSAVALFTPQQYGASAAEALYSVDGVYTFASSGEQVSARINFRDGQMVNVFGITGQGETGAPREITPQVGDTFTIVEKWLQLDAQGSVESTFYQNGLTTLTFNGMPFTWQDTYAAPGYYILGFVVTDLDGNSVETYGQVQVK